MPENIDSITVTLIVTWTAAVVAGVRARVPKIDGVWVLLATLVAAGIASAMFLAPMPEWIRYGLLGFTGAVGGISLLDRFQKKGKEGSP